MKRFKQLRSKKISARNPKHQWLEKDYPGYLHMIFCQGIHGGVLRGGQLFPKLAFKHGYVINEDTERLDWFWDARDLAKTRKIFLQKAKTNLKFFLKIYNRWEKDHTKLLKIYNRAESLTLSKLSDTKLYKEYEIIYQASVEQGATGYLVDAFLSSDGDWLAEFIIGQIKNQELASDAVAILTLPARPSYSNEEEIALLKITKKIPARNWVNYQAFAKYIKAESGLYPLFEKHARRFYWVQNNYFPLILTADDFVKKAWELFRRANANDVAVQHHGNAERKQQLLKQIGNSYLTRVITMTELATHIQDYRKMALVRLSHFMFLFLAEMGKRRNLSLKEILNTIEPELKEIFLEQSINRDKLKARMEKNFAFGIGQSYGVYEGSDYVNYVDETEFRQTVNTLATVTGVPACFGLAKGIVRIVKDARRPGTFIKGDILVTNNTTPEFVPLMRLAGAIVTEQGGITTHAAIVSRELGVPCVIGTKIATKVFKDGDLVEVDATKGIVKKL